MKNAFCSVAKLALVGLIVSMGVGIVGFSVAGAESEQDYTKMPGYVDFDAMEIFGDVEASVEVFLKGSVLVLVREAVKDDDPELSDLLSRIDYVRVQVFPLDDVNPDAVKTKTRDMSKQLEKSGWDIAVRVREDDEQVYVYLMPGDKDDISGLVVMVVEDDEATFVNIVGNIDPAKIGEIGRSLHIDGMDYPIKVKIDGDTKVIIENEEKKDKKDKRVHR